MVNKVHSLDEFHSIIQSGSVIVAFCATWCGPCKNIAGDYERLAGEYDGSVVFVKVDVDEVADAAQECGVESMPTFQFFKDGEKVAEFKGADVAGLTDFVANNA